MFTTDGKETIRVSKKITAKIAKVSKKKRSSSIYKEGDSYTGIRIDDVQKRLNDHANKLMSNLRKQIL